MLSNRAPAQVAHSVEQWTEKAFQPQSALPLTTSNRKYRIARAIARGGLSLRKARALFGVRFGGAA